ncbi:hypothetical protein ACLK17_18075 [Escherichia coli]
MTSLFRSNRYAGLYITFIAEGPFSHATGCCRQTAYRNVFMDEDPGTISGWLSVMLKVSCAGDAGKPLNAWLASERPLRQ